MPREQTRRVDPLNLGAPDSRGAALGVYAAPTATPGRATMSPEAEGLLRGLSSLAASVTATANEIEQTDRAEGRSFGRSGGSREEAARRGKSFLDGYLEGSGEAAAVSDAEELSARYQTEVDKTDPSIEQFVGRFYQEKMKGAQDAAFRRGYDRVFGNEALKLRSKHGEGLAVSVIDKKREVAQRQVDYLARTFVEQKKPLGPEFLAAVNTIASTLALSNLEKDEAILLTLEAYGSKGVPEVFEVARSPRPDSKTGEVMPSLYDNPRWRDRIERGEREAARIKLARDKADEDAAKREREERQGEVIAEVARLIIAGDGESARKLAFRALQNPALFSNPKDIKNALDLAANVTDNVSKLLQEAEGDVENQVLMGIYTGTVKDIRDISNRTDLSPATKRRLVTSFFQWRSQQRQEAASLKAADASVRASDAQVRAAHRAAFSDPQFVSASRLIESALAPEKGLLAAVTKQDEAAKMSSRMALQELINWKAQNIGADGASTNAKALEIIKRHRESLKIAEETASPERVLERLGIPYKSVRELEAAASRGEVDPITYQMMFPILKQQHEARTKK